MLSEIPSISELESKCDALLASPNSLVADDMATTQRYLSKVTEGRARLHPPMGNAALNFTALEMTLGAVQFQLMASHCQGRFDQSTVRSPGNRVLLHIPLQGRLECSQGARSVAVDPGAMLVVSSPGKLWKTWSGHRKWLTVAIQRPALRRALATACQVDFDEEAEFASLDVVPLDAVPTLTSLIKAIVMDLGGAEPLFRHRATALSMENAFLLALLNSVPGSHSRALIENSATCVPYYVVRAEKYMRHNIREQIAIGDLATAAGVSERTIYYGFQKFLGKSPMRYCALLRLNLAREALIRCRVHGCNITELAISLGYATSSHFSRDYRKRFGESPSDTLRRSYPVAGAR